jgi:RNA polymerase sigma-70 factor (ECF subfamily)
MASPPGGVSSPQDIDRWLAAAAAGSVEALGQLFEACRPYLLLVANAEVGTDLQAKVAPSDLVQQTFLEGQRDFAGFRGRTEADLLAWLRQILLHNVANVRRHYRATDMRQVGREVPVTVAGPLSDGQPSPSSLVAAREEDTALRQALADLPADHRDVLRLRQDDQSFEEIGRQLGRSAEAARKLWARAVDRLSKVLSAEHESRGRHP